MATYLITGVAGFIAARVAELLLDEGHTVVGLDNLNNAYDVRLKEWRLTRLQTHSSFHFYQLDITDYQALRTTAAEALTAIGAPGYDALLNLAARAGVRYSVENPWIYIETNVTGTLNGLELCREMGIGKFILSSTSSLYGASNPLPFREDAGTDGPLSPYAASKKGAEALCYTYHYLHNIDITVFRYFTVYGPAGRPDMAPFRFVQWINEGHPLRLFGDGSQSRDFTYVDDIAHGTIAGLRPLGYEVINLGSDRPVTINDFIQVVEELTGRSAVIERHPVHPADMPATWADIGKAEHLLGWRPQTRLPDGMARTVTWYHEERTWVSNVKTD